MHEANPTWGAPRTHGELLKLGFTVAQSALSKYLPRNRKPPVVHALGNAAAYDVALREALDLYRSIGATGHADQLTSELQAWFEALPRLARFASDSACVR